MKQPSPLDEKALTPQEVTEHFGLDSATRQSGLPGVSRSSVYYRPKPESREGPHSLERLDERFTAHPIYGSRRLQVMLKQEGVPVGRRRLMNQLGLQAVGPTPDTRKPHPEHETRIGTDGRGRCHDDIFVERPWSPVRREWGCPCPCDGGIEQRRSLADCFDWYNRRRPHPSLGRYTPEETCFDTHAQARPLAA
ncbi:MAG: hypothetical protein Fur0039_17940 [Rhodocyclaceae bacterium]